MRKIVGQTFALQSDDAGNSPVDRPDGYTDKLLKLIPAESITTYIGINGILESAKSFNAALDWGVFAVIFIGTAFYLKTKEGNISFLQISVSCIAFFAYVLAQGAVFERQMPSYSPIYGAILVPLIVFVAPLIKNEKFQ